MSDDEIEFTALIEKIDHHEEKIKELTTLTTDYEEKIDNLTTEIEEKEALISKLQSILAKSYIASTEGGAAPGVTDFATAYNNLIKENLKK